MTHTAVIAQNNNDASQDCQIKYEELRDVCVQTITQADEYIAAQAKELMELKVIQGKLMGQIETQQKDIIDLRNPPWYLKPMNTLLIGIILGGGAVLYGTR